MKSKIQKASESKSTTVVGLSSSILAAVLLLVPEPVRQGCFDAIQTSESPIMVGSLIVVGILGTVIGPSLANRKG